MSMNCRYWANSESAIFILSHQQRRSSKSKLHRRHGFVFCPVLEARFNILLTDATVLFGENKHITELERAAHKRYTAPLGAMYTVSNSVEIFSEMGGLIPQIADTIVIGLHPFILPLNKRFYVRRKVFIQGCFIGAFCKVFAALAFGKHCILVHTSDRRLDVRPSAMNCAACCA